MWSMSLTEVVIDRSKYVMIRSDISSGGKPLYCHTMLTTGRRMFGKMSIGVRRIASGPNSRITIARTRNV